MMIKNMRKLCLGALLLCSSYPALADSWIVYGEEKPDRSAMLLDEKSIVDRSTGGERIYDIKGSIIFELAKQPDQIALNYRVYCNRGTLEGKDFTMLYSDGRRERIGSGNLPEHQPADFSEEQVIAFTCAKPADREKGQFIPLRDARYPVNYVRNIVWMDPKDLKKLSDSVDASTAAVMGGVRNANKSLNDYNHDTNRQGGSNVLESWLGHDEKDFVASWGNPNNWADVGGMRELYYSWGSQRQIFQGGNLAGEENYWCSVTIYVRAGKIWDYNWDGNSCDDLHRR